MRGFTFLVLTPVVGIGLIFSAPAGVALDLREVPPQMDSAIP